MGKKTFATTLLATTLLSSIALSSCSKDDGDWDPMKWRTEVKTVKDEGTRFVQVPAEGGTYVYKCKNYDGFWLAEVNEEENGNTKVYWSEHFTDNHNFSSAATNVNITGNTLTVTIKPNDTKKTRYVEVTVTAGDIFDTFKYKQY